MEIKKKRKKKWRQEEEEEEDARNLKEQLSQQGREDSIFRSLDSHCGDSPRGWHSNVIHHPAPRLMDVLT